MRLPHHQTHRSTIRPLRITALLSLVLPATLAATGCEDQMMQQPPMALRCTGDPLPLQNARAFTLGETFYLPAFDAPAAQAGQCPKDLAWEVSAAPTGSKATIYQDGAPQPRLTPDLAGEYRLRVKGTTADPEITLKVVARTPAERFRNHHLTPLFGAARVGDEIWTANGATYSVTRVGPGSDGKYAKRGEIVTASWPAAIAWREGMSYALVAQRGADTIGFIDRTRGVLEDALWVGDEPTAIAIAPDAKRAYVSLATMRRVAVVDLERRALVGNVEVGFDPRALALSADGKRLVHVYRLTLVAVSTERDPT